MGFLDGGIQALGSIGTNIIGGLFSANQAKKNRAFQERMYKQQYQDSIDFWKMQQDYALPSAELQRIKDAGLNPLLMYSDGAGVQQVSQPQLPSAPHGAQAQASFQNPFAGFGLMQAQADALKAQAGNLRSDSELKVQQALESAARTIKEREQANREGLGYKFEYDSYYDRLESIKLQNDAERAQASLNDALANTEVSKRNEIEANIKRIDNEASYIDAKMQSETKMTEQEIKESNQRIDNSIKTTLATVRNLDAQGQKAFAEAAYARAQKVLIDNPEYRKYFNAEQLGRAYKALMEGRNDEFVAQINKWRADCMPKDTDSFWSWNTVNKVWRGFWEVVVHPATSTLGELLGGSASFVVKPK